ncbi:type II toxin-antitoxin system HicA family toxin [Candidatus Thiosymbion oneisti]
MPFKYREIERRLMKMGYRVVRQKGSHVIFGDLEKSSFSGGRE